MVEAMEVKKGFQKTEVGVIPSDWKLCSYGQLFDFLTTATYSRAQLSENDEIGYVHYGDIHTRCQYFLDCDKIVLPSIKKELQRKYPFLKDGDLLVVDASEDYKGVGKSVEVRNLRNKKVISGLHTFLLRDKDGIIANGFKGYLHSNRLVKKQMDTLATGLKVYGVSKTNLKRILIPIPPTKTEQTAIATALNDTDALITQLEKLIAKKQAIKQGAMQELLKPKEGWKENSLTEYVNYIHGKAHEKNIVENGKYVVVNSKFISSGGKVVKHSNNNFCPAKKNDILTVLSDLPNGKALAKCFYVEGENKYAVNQRICIWRSKGANQRFLFYLLNRNEYFLGLDDGISQTHILNHHIEKCRISMPTDYAEQEKIGAILFDMDIEIEVLEKKIEKYKMMKQGMMQNLLTGKIRLI